MGAQKLIVFGYHFNFWNMGSVNGFLYQKLVLFVGVFCFSIATYLLSLFVFIRTHVFRFRQNNCSSKNNSDYSKVVSAENIKEDSNLIEPETERGAKQDVIEFTDSEIDGFGEKEAPQFCFKFKFPTYEELSKSRGDNGHFASLETLPSTSTSNKFEFTPGMSFNGFIDEPEVVSFEVKEVNEDINCGSFVEEDIVDDGFSSDKDFNRVHSESDAVREEMPENLTNGIWGEEVTEKGESVDAENNLQGDDHSEKNSFSMNSEPESTRSNHLRTSQSVDSYDDGFLSDGEFELDSSMNSDGEKIEMSDSEETQESENFDEEDSDLMEEVRNLEETHLENLDSFDSNFLSQEDFQEELNKSIYGEFSCRDDDKPINGDSGKSEKSEKMNSGVSDSEETNKLETLWEHQELIEQLKMELKKVRATGLPTIFEESESPKIMEDLKPWKIDDKFQQGNPMGELQKFYKSYRERMRKFDILNYQKMYAIGFLQLKDPLQSISTQKSSVPEISSILSQNFLQSKHKKNESDPTMKFIKELQSDLEVVYVGQMCLSWEILHWQYGKALDLWDSDPRWLRRYNEVAGEFQQFQVLLQRFIEDEPFQGPRVQNYVKNRCVLRNLLQVPLVREDSSKDRKKARRSEKSDYAITSDVLVEILEESIRIFWRFVRADKECNSAIAKGRRRPLVELQDPADNELLMEVWKNLQKKERKLKDLFRSANCILRRFQKCREDDNSDQDQVLYFFSQVDLKLVSRVLNMSRITTEQLVWCRSKLGNISFVKRKIHVEPSFSLFPT